MSHVSAATEDIERFRNLIHTSKQLAHEAQEFCDGLLKRAAVEDVERATGENICALENEITGLENEISELKEEQKKTQEILTQLLQEILDQPDAALRTSVERLLDAARNGFSSTRRDQDWAKLRATILK